MSTKINIERERGLKSNGGTNERRKRRRGKNIGAEVTPSTHAQAFDARMGEKENGTGPQSS